MVTRGVIPDPPVEPGSGSTVQTDDTGTDVHRGPTRIEVDGDPNGLWWDAGENRLYLADANGSG